MGSSQVGNLVTYLLLVSFGTMGQIWDFQPYLCEWTMDAPQSTLNLPIELLDSIQSLCEICTFVLEDPTDLMVWTHFRPCVRLYLVWFKAISFYVCILGIDTQCLTSPSTIHRNNQMNSLLGRKKMQWSIYMPKQCPAVENAHY